MTVGEFHIAFDIELDKTLDFEYPYISPEQKDYWLSKAQDRFVKSRAFGNNSKQQGFEESEKRIDDIRTIVVRSPQLSSNISGNTFEVTLPDDYLYLFRHQCTTVSSKYGTQLVSGKQVTQDGINNKLKDPFWTPLPDEPLYYIIGNSIVYETKGGFTIPSSNITYIRIYNPIQHGSIYLDVLPDLECELPIHTHSEILDIAISMILENIESQRYQTNLNELTKSE